MQIPPDLAVRAQHYFQQLDPAPTHELFQKTWEKVFACSDFVAESCVRHPEWLQEMLERGELDRELSMSEYQEQLARLICEANDETELSKKLRQFRLKAFLRIAWRDLAGFSDVFNTMRELSDLADVILIQTRDKLHHWLQQERGERESQELLIIAMGKLGGAELNFSSDIDLIFAFPDSGSEFFKRLAQRLIRVLNLVTEDGFVFRVDMRLRPYGDAGELVMSMAALEAYYQQHGRDWERYAMVKARVLPEHSPFAQNCQTLLKPFVYRRYVDYGAIEALRQMKHAIESEVKSKSLQDNIKRGSGGIRQIEFIAQVFQLIHGGQDLALQQRSLFAILNHLEAHNTLPIETIHQLRDAAIFFRNVEHRLQMFRDEQTHAIPHDPLAQTRLAYSMNFPDWDTFTLALTTHRSHVETHFARMVAEPRTEATIAITDPMTQRLTLLWLGKLSHEDNLKLLSDCDFSDPQEVARLITEFRLSHRCRQLTPIARQRLDQLFPRLLHLISKQELPIITLRRLMSLLEAIVKRSAYLVMLLEKPQHLKQFLTLFASSAWIAELTTSFPFLLDVILHHSLHYSAMDLQQISHDCRYHLLAIPEQDLEQQMEALRRFKLSKILELASAEVLGLLPILKVCEQLTFIAEAILQQVTDLARKDLLLKHSAELHDELEFSIISYGKLGGVELNYHSDLDLVFLHQHESADAPLLIRLAQKILHLLSTRTANGILYSVDTRLRPSGTAGLLVSPFSAFRDYQLNQAWTWEHQALIRARVVYGSDNARKAFDSLRREVLCQVRDKSELARSVVEMREKIWKTHAVSLALGQFDLKHSRGGIIDIEFLVQFRVLAHAAEHPSILDNTDNMRIIDKLISCQCIDEDDGKLLQNAYNIYRTFLHRCFLSRTSPTVTVEVAQPWRQSIIEIWERWFFSSC